MRYYPATLETLTENGKPLFVGTLSFSAVHSAIADGESLDELASALQSHLVGAVEFAFKADRPFPNPTPPQKGQIAVLMPTLVEAKVLIHNERLRRQLTKTDLGKLAGFSPAEMQRLLNPWYKSSIEKLDALFVALGLAPQLAVF